VECFAHFEDQRHVRSLVQRAHVAAAVDVEQHKSLGVRVRANLVESGIWSLTATDHMGHPPEQALRTHRAYGFCSRRLNVSTGEVDAQSMSCSQIEDGDDAAPRPSCSSICLP
jgi:hypothetical protein